MYGEFTQLDLISFTTVIFLKNLFSEFTVFMPGWLQEQEFEKMFDSEAFDPIIRQYFSQVYMPSADEVERVALLLGQLARAEQKSHGEELPDQPPILADEATMDPID